jgi:hypothetical protein
MTKNKLFDIKKPIFWIIISVVLCIGIGIYFIISSHENNNEKTSIDEWSRDIFAITECESQECVQNNLQIAYQKYSIDIEKITNNNKVLSLYKELYYNEESDEGIKIQNAWFEDVKLFLNKEQNTDATTSSDIISPARGESNNDFYRLLFIKYFKSILSDNYEMQPISVDSDGEYIILNYLPKYEINPNKVLIKYYLGVDGELSDIKEEKVIKGED